MTSSTKATVGPALGPALARPLDRSLRGRGAVAAMTEYFVSPVREANARQALRCLTPDIREQDRVLDLGSGTGILGALVQSRIGCSVVGCDVVAMNVALRDFHLFDGEHVPFECGAFDITLLAYVLHHVPDPLSLLREAARVARRGVIVVEDTPRCGLERAWGRLHVRTFNDVHGLPYGHVRSDDEWLPIFAAAGLQVVRRHHMQRLERFPPIARTQYTLARLPR